MRRMKTPPAWRAKSQLKRAVRAPPTCRKPVGEGAKRTRGVWWVSCIAETMLQRFHQNRLQREMLHPGLFARQASGVPTFLAGYSRYREICGITLLFILL